MGHARARPDDLEELKQLLTDRVEELALQLLGKPDRVGFYDWRWGKKGGRSLIIRTCGGKRRGTYTSFVSGEKPGSPLDLIRIELGVPIGEAIGRARDFLGLTPGLSLPAMSAERRAELAAERIQQDGVAADKAAAQLKVRALWDAGVPLPGTLGDQYLASRGLRAPAAWRWHARERAVLVPATDDAGVVWAVQRINVGLDGRKVTDEEIRKRPWLISAKTTLGPRKGRPARLPGPPGSPLLVGEGPETVASPWQVMGFEAWIGLGSAADLPVPPGRLVVLLVDDDADAEEKVERVLAKWRARGATGIPVWPFDERRRNGHDFNTLLQEQGEAAVAARINAVLPPACEYAAPTATLEAATGELKSAIASTLRRAIAANVAIDPAMEARVEAARRVREIKKAVKAGTATPDDYRERVEMEARVAAPLPLAPHVGLNVEMGLGKTHEAIGGLDGFHNVAGYVEAARAAGTSGKVFWISPTLTLADQTAADMNRRGRAPGANRRLSAGVLRGLEAEDPDAKVPPKDKNDDTGRMCLNLLPARLAIEAGVSVPDTVCGTAGKEGACVHHGKCPAHRMLAALVDCDVVLSTHHFASHPLPRKIADGRNLTVIDEKFAMGLAFSDTISLATLLSDLDETPVRRKEGIDHLATDELRATMRAVVEALEAHDDGTPPSIDRFLAVHLDPQRLRGAAAQQKWRLKPVDMFPGQPLKERQAAEREARSNKRVWPAVRLLHTIADFIDGKPDTSGRIELVTEERKGRGERRVLVHGMRALSQRITDRPVLHLDGTMVPEIVRRALPRLEVPPRITAVAPHARYVQVLSADDDRGGWGKRSFLPDLATTETGPLDLAVDEADRKRRLERRRRLGRIAELRDWLVGLRRRLGPGLIVTYEAAEHFFRGIEGVRTAHFNAISGLNAHEAVAWTVVLGRPMPPPLATAEIAKQVFGIWAEPEPAVETEAGVMMADGSRRAVTTRRFADPGMEAVRRAIADDQVQQAGARGRAVRRTAANPLVVFILSDVVVPYPLEAVLGWPDLRPDRVERMSARGLVLHSPSDACAVYPDLFDSPEAARRAFKADRRSTGHSPIDNISMGIRPVDQPVRYRLAPTAEVPKPKTRVVTVTDPARLVSLRAELEASLGSLAMFEVQPVPEAAFASASVVAAPVLAPMTIDEDEEAADAARHLATERRRQGIEPVYAPGRPLFADIAPRAEEIARLIAEAPRMVVEPSGSGEPPPVAWSPPATAFEASPGASDQDRMLLDLVSLLPWTTILPAGVPGPPGWTAAMPGGP